MTTTLLSNLAMVLAFMSLLWLLGLVRKDVSLVDPFWGSGFMLVAWLSIALNWPASPRALLLGVLVTVWGARLSAYLLWRNWGQGEDRRYRAMREQHGERFWWFSFFTVFLLQGLLLWFIALPIQAAAVVRDEVAWRWLDVCGVALWCIGLYFEAVGDWQLARFKADPAHAGQVMDRGLWRYTRHPNYFGDFCVWWGIYLISLQASAAWTLFSPLAMSLLLMKISGVSLLESTIQDRRPRYAEYQARTSAFFPWKIRR